MSGRINAIFGMEPLRDQEMPVVHVVGEFAVQPSKSAFRVTKIERREENFGDHGLLWFDVYDGDRIAISMQGRAVAEVHYATETAA